MVGFPFCSHTRRRFTARQRTPASLQRVAGTSAQDIDGLISELQILRETIQEHGLRVQRNR